MVKHIPVLCDMYRFFIIQLTQIKRNYTTPYVV